MSLKAIIAIVMILHGLIHASLSWVPVAQPGAMRTPFFPSWTRKDVDALWPISKMKLPENSIRTIGWLLWLITTGAFALAGLGLVGIPGLASIWTGLAVTGSVASMLLIGLFWHPWLPVGIVLDLVVLAGIFLKIPKSLFE